MIDILPQIVHNYIAQAAFWGWFTAQAIKFVWQLVRHGKFRPERLVGSGGFPSSHTSLSLLLLRLFTLRMVYQISLSCP